MMSLKTTSSSWNRILLIAVLLCGLLSVVQARTKDDKIEKWTRKYERAKRNDNQRKMLRTKEKLMKFGGWDEDKNKPKFPSSADLPSSEPSESNDHISRYAEQIANERQNAKQRESQIRREMQAEKDLKEAKRKEQELRDTIIRERDTEDFLGKTLECLVAKPCSNTDDCGGRNEPVSSGTCRMCNSETKQKAWVPVELSTFGDGRDHQDRDQFQVAFNRRFDEGTYRHTKWLNKVCTGGFSLVRRKDLRIVCPSCRQHFAGAYGNIKDKNNLKMAETVNPQCKDKYHMKFDWAKAKAYHKAHPVADDIKAPNMSKVTLIGQKYGRGDGMFFSNGNTINSTWWGESGGAYNPDSSSETSNDKEKEAELMYDLGEARKLSGGALFTDHEGETTKHWEVWVSNTKDFSERNMKMVSVKKNKEQKFELAEPVVTRYIKLKLLETCGGHCYRLDKVTFK